MQSAPAESAEPSPPVCGECGTISAPGAALTWTVETVSGGVRHTCERCTRHHLRAMEAGLRPEHW